MGNPSETYFEINRCVRGHVYRLLSRNLKFGVFHPENHNGFIGIREKLGSRFLFTEHHWDNGPPYGTAKPVEDVGILPEEIELREHFEDVCMNCSRSVVYDRTLPQHSDGVFYPGTWCHVLSEDDLLCWVLRPCVKDNEPLLTFLTHFENLG